MTTPHQLRVKVGIAWVANLFGRCLFGLHKRLLLDRRNIDAPGLIVREGFDVFGADFGGHDRVMLDVVVFPGIKKPDATRLKIGHVAGYDGHAMHQCGGGNQAVPNGAWVGDMQFGTALCHRSINGQNAICKCG